MRNSLQAVVISFCLLVTLAGCSVLSDRKLSDLAQATVVSVAGHYLDDLNRGNVDSIEGSILWVDFLTNRGTTPLTKDQVFEQIRSLKTKWSSDDQNPLRQLEVLSVTGRGDHAEIELRKTGHKEFPIITIKLIWIGGGWLIQHDSIFGAEGLLAKGNG